MQHLDAERMQVLERAGGVGVGEGVKNIQEDGRKRSTPQVAVEPFTLKCNRQKHPMPSLVHKPQPVSSFGAGLSVRV